MKNNWKEFHDRYQGGFLLSRLVKVKITLKVLSFVRRERDVLVKRCSDKVMIHSLFNSLQRKVLQVLRWPRMLRYSTVIKIQHF